MVVAYYVRKTGRFAFWPLTLPDEIKPHPAHESAKEAADLAKTQWIRIWFPTKGAKYETFAAINQVGDPLWPTDDLTELFLRTALEAGRYIGTFDHPIVQALQGLAG